MEKGEGGLDERPCEEGRILLSWKLEMRLFRLHVQYYTILGLVYSVSATSWARAQDVAL
jgi:hypothetical protein